MGPGPYGVSFIALFDDNEDGGGNKPPPYGVPIIVLPPDFWNHSFPTKEETYRRLIPVS